MKTTNYEQFNFITANRKISKIHVKNLVKSISEHGYFNSKPITVNDNFEISDGQHRFLACKELGLPITYEIDNVNVNTSMVVLNTTSTIWRLNEFINHYADMGIPCYVELRELMDNNPKYGSSNCILLYGGVKISPKKIRAGALINRSKNLSRYIEMLEFFRDKVKFCFSGHFVLSVINIINDSQFTDKHIERIKLNSFTIIQCARVEQYLIQFKKLAKIRH